MARDFSGSDTTTHRVDAGSITVPTAVSVLCWARSPDGGHDYGRLVSWASRAVDFAVDKEAFEFTAGALVFNSQDWSTNEGLWGTTDGPWNGATGWHHSAVTYDAASTGNDPTFYFDGVQKTTTELETPSGSFSGSTGNLIIGNRTDFNRVWGGDIAWVSVYNVVLTDEEILDAMHRGWTPRGLYGVLMPLWGNSDPEPDWSGNANNGTVTGAAGIIDMPPMVPRTFTITVPYVTSGEAAAGGEELSIPVAMASYRRRRVA